MDQVHFDALYQVHHPGLRTPSEPLWVDLVHPLKSHLVHLTTKTITTRGAETLLRPGQPVFSAPRGAETLLRPGQLRSFSVDSPAVDQVHFDALYQVHHPGLRTPSEPLWVDLVHPLKSHLVHLTTKTITTRGTETLLRPGQPVFFAARGAETPLRPGQLPSFSIDSPAVDLVHFEGPYQVHQPCPRTPSEPLWVDLVHPLKSHLVHLTTKTITTRGAETLLRPRHTSDFQIMFSISSLLITPPNERDRALALHADFRRLLTNARAK